MKKILIFGSGEREEKSFYNKFLNEENILIVAVDGGANSLFELGRIPDILIGDNDSIRKEVLEKLRNSHTKIFNYPSEKNYSDFELASDYIINNEERSDILLFNMFGKRIDQLLFNIEVCKKLTNAGFRVSMVGNNCEIYFLKDNSILEIKGKIGDTVSILPAKEAVNILKTVGLKYELINEKLYNETTRGLSNELIKDSCRIEINEGMAIIVFLRK